MRRDAPRVLLIEDDAEMRELVQRALSDDGFEVEVHSRAKSAERALRQKPIAAVILDVWLPDANGIELCRSWRQSGIGIPVLILTARTDVGSRVAGLDAGADDYLGKPFAIAELRARLRAVIRRGPRTRKEQRLERGDVAIDFARRQAWVGGVEVPITRREFDVLERIAQGEGHAVSRDELLEDVWGRAAEDTAASFEVILARLRRKLERDQRGLLIRTLRGFGYALAPAEGEKGT